VSQNSALALFDVTAVLTVGVCLAIPLRRLRQPTVTGEILAGLALGPRARSGATHAGVLREFGAVGGRRAARGLTELIIVTVGRTMNILDGRMSRGLDWRDVLLEDIGAFDGGVPGAPAGLEYLAGPRD
jgi:hypothetical protein